MIKIVWVSGACSQLTIQPAIQRTADLDGYDRLIARIRERAAEGYDDREIARIVTSEGFRSARRQDLSGDSWRMTSALNRSPLQTQIGPTRYVWLEPERGHPKMWVALEGTKNSS